MKVQIDPKIKAAVLSAEKATGCSCYVVGGYVRNQLLGKNSDDIDFVVEGDSIIFAKNFAKNLGGKKVVVFPRFKTAKVCFDPIFAEFVSARSEKYDHGSRKPTVETSTLYQDLRRRDFTVNSIACRVSGSGGEKLIDYFGGIKDLKNKIIRTPLPPLETYSEDPLRMLRCVRFASVLDFKIEKASFNAIAPNADRLDIVSVERISEELFKMISSDRPVKGIWLLYKSGLLKKLLPELTDLQGVEKKNGQVHKDVFIHTLKVLNNISRVTKKTGLRIAALMHDIGKKRTKFYKKGQGWTFHGHDEAGARMFADIAKRLKFSNDLTDYVWKIIRLHHRPIALAKEEVTDSGVRRLLFEGGDDVEDLMLLCRADITTANKSKLGKYLQNFDRLSEKIVEVEEKDRIRNFKPPVSGLDIMRLFSIKPGPQVGKIKNIIVEAVLNGEIENDRESAFRLLKRLQNTGG